MSLNAANCRLPAADGLPRAQDALNARRPEYDRIIVWRSSWIPVISYGVTDRTSGLYLDTSTGYLGRWSRYNEGQDDKLDTLATYLEDIADMLEALLSPYGTSRAWSVGCWCGAAGSTPRRKAIGSHWPVEHRRRGQLGWAPPATPAAGSD
ncbi:hypothetical protein LV779_31915 [Streptomyces thinghirensis]|nr:hypothetical protein [Streptomyces thinghirensis]